MKKSHRSNSRSSGNPIIIVRPADSLEMLEWNWPVLSSKLLCFKICRKTVIYQKANAWQATHKTCKFHSHKTWKLITIEIAPNYLKGTHLQCIPAYALVVYVLSY